MNPSIPADSEAAADTPPVHASNSCWHGLAQREQARLQLVHSRPAAAHDHPQREDTDPAAHTGDTLADRMRHHVQTAYRDGRCQGERLGYTRGVWWGAVCGALWTLAIISALVFVFAAADQVGGLQLVSRTST